MKASILISSKDRRPLLRRTLWAVANRPPSCEFEVVVCDDGSEEDVLGELKTFSSRFPWKFVSFDSAAFEEATGLKKLWGNPAVTNNVAFRHATGDLIFQMGNEVIAVGDCFDNLLADAESVSARTPHWLVVSTTYDCPPEVLDTLDSYGSNLCQQDVVKCHKWPLQSSHYRSDVTNYVSLAPRSLWETLGGYDERYFAGIGAEDSDFVRRARALPDFRMEVSDGTSLHQYHGGRTRYYRPDPRVISEAKWAEGVAVNRAVYDAWDGKAANSQKWAFGTIGIKEVLTNQ